MDEKLNTLSAEIIGAAMEVHRELGPGLLESTYHKALVHELRLRKLEVPSEVSLPVTYKDLEVRDAYRIDVVVNNTIILELKAVQKIEDLHKAQLLTYLRLAKNLSASS
ncbi:GxxExxY protein [Verrucomicrobiaceae bacterium 227]